MSAFLGLRYWQHMTVRSLHGHGIAAEIIGSSKATCTPNIISIRSYHLLQILQKTISDQNRLFYDSKAQGQAFKGVWIHLPSSLILHSQLYVTFSLFSSFGNVAGAVTEGHWQGIENDGFIASDFCMEKCLPVLSI